MFLQVNETLKGATQRIVRLVLLWPIKVLTAHLSQLWRRRDNGR